MPKRPATSAPDASSTSDMPPPERPGAENSPERRAAPRISRQEKEPTKERETKEREEPEDRLAVDDEEEEGGTGDEMAEMERAEEEYEKGFGVGVRSPEMERARRTSRLRESEVREFAPEQPLDMAPLQGREGPLGTVENEEIESLTRKLGAVGASLRMAVTRIFPDDVPPSERGPHQWIDIPLPTADSVMDQIKSRFGGGRFEIIVSDRNPEERHRAMKTVIDIGGDMVPMTLAGREWFRRKYQVDPPLHVLTLGADGKPTNGFAPVGSPDSAGGVLSMWLQLQDAEKRREQESRDKSMDRDSSLAAAVIQSMNSRSGGTGIAQAIIAAAPLAMEFFRMMREDSRKDREASDRRWSEMNERMLALQKPQQPAEVAASMQAILAFQGKRMELELESYKKNSDRLTDEMLKALRSSGKEEDATILGSIASMLRESGPDMIRGLAPLLTSMLGGQSAAQAVRNQFPGVDPRIIAARGGQQPALPPRPMNPMAAPTQPQPMAPLPGPRPAGPAPEAPASGPGPIPEGAPSAEQAPKPVQAEGAEEEGGERIGHPDDFVGGASLAALQDWIWHARGFSGRGVDPDAAWGWVSKTKGPTAGNTIEVIYGLLPVVVRQRIEETEPDKPFSVEGWVEGGPEPILLMAREFDEFLTANVAAREWLTEFLDRGPWAEEEVDDEEEAS